MKHLRILSWAMTVLGILMIVGSQLFGLGLTWVLAGALMTWAGIVKIVVVLIWTNIAHLGTDEHKPEQAI
ncbi:MAG TPA: hypothetical protein VNZ58_13320 [Thermomicrobiales bacterium]|nr:hypothetical protein [Thermomicrobiales bacterium]